MASTATTSTASTSNSNLLGSLPERPPTPPREACHKLTDTTTANPLATRAVPFDPCISLQTPPNAASPSPSANPGTHPTSSRTRKKVEWSRHTEYKEPPRFPESDKPVTSPASVPSSTASLKPIKGILKASSSPQPLPSSLGLEPDGSTPQVNVAEMLDSTIKQLAGQDRAVRLDAYVVLARSLKASNNLPDRVALQNKISLFTQFIQRDVTSKNTDGTPDTNLAHHAMNLLIAFLNTPSIASKFPYDFGVFIIESSIHTFVAQGLSKHVVRSWMQVVAHQNFTAKVMNGDRVGRLVSALHTIEDRIRGKSIVMGRIQVYKRLIRQVPVHMAAYNIWLEGILMDMHSEIVSIRQLSINVGLEAGFALRSEKHILRQFSQTWQMANENVTYGTFYLHKLEDQTKDRQRAAFVPQILSVLALFMPCPLDRWKNYTLWLQIFQKAFNASDASTKQEANYAWNRYIYLSLGDSQVTPKMLSTLCQPLLSQLRRKTVTKHPDDGSKFRNMVTHGICSLYYYAFAPNRNKYSPDMIWDVAVHPVMQEILSLHGKPGLSGDLHMTASSLLIGLLDTWTPRVWQEDRIRNPAPVKFDELPGIDSKWVRKNNDKVFLSAGPILEARFTEFTTKSSWAARLWKNFVGAISTASARDIKTSEDTSKFFGRSLGLLCKIWSKGPEYYGQEASEFLSNAAYFTSTLAQELGPLILAEKKMVLIGVTPSDSGPRIISSEHGAQRLSNKMLTPVQHLYAILCTPLPGVDTETSLAPLLLEVLKPLLHKSETAALSQCRELYNLKLASSSRPWAAWDLTAQHYEQLVIDELSSPEDVSSTSDQGQVLRDYVAHLGQGLLLFKEIPFPVWNRYATEITKRLQLKHGEPGRTLAFIEPLSKRLYEQAAKKDVLSPAVLATVNMLFRSAKLPLNQHAVEAASRKLWGVPASGVSAAVDLENLFQLGELTSKWLYVRTTTEGTADPDTIARAESFITSITHFLQQSNELLVHILSNKAVQGLLLPWIRDEQKQFTAEADCPGVLSSCVESLWKSICDRLVGRSRLMKLQPDAIEPLLVSGFESTTKSTVRTTIDLWNDVRAYDGSLDCSSSLKSVLSVVGARIDSGSQKSHESSAAFGAQTTILIPSHSDVSLHPTASESRSGEGRNEEVSQPPNQSRSSRKRRREPTTDSELTKPAEKKASAKLRHDDSQLAFTTIPSPDLKIDESQNLTEHQREVRERQAQSAVAYSNLGTNLQQPIPQEAGKSTPTSGKPRSQKATPEKPATYGELISSTPTPKRGQVLNIDDYSDPPSSPPEPRPYPLLEEIQSRSRANSSMEDWEFSSPAGTPVTSRQMAQDVELPKLHMTNDSSAGDVAYLSGGRTRIGNRALQRFRAAVGHSTTQAQSGQSAESHAEKDLPKPPSTPSQRRTRRSTSKSQETRETAEDEFVDARTSPGSTPVAQRQTSEFPASTRGQSFARGEDASHRVQLVELESRRVANPDLPSSSPMRIDDEEEDVVEEDGRDTKALESASGSITVLSPSRTINKTASAIVPSTPPEASQQSSTGDSGKKKRKRNSRNTDRRRKKRKSELEQERSQENEIAETQQELIVDPPRSGAEKGDSDDRAYAGVQTRRSSRRIRKSTSKASHKVSESRKEPDASGRHGQDVHEELDNTDEELMSQLVEEAKAASQQSIPEQLSSKKPAPALSMIEASVARSHSARKKDTRTPADVESTGAAHETEPPSAQQDGTATGVIMQSFKGGLAGLRSAALNRDDVYKLEDMLMDIKRELFEAERRGRADSTS